MKIARLIESGVLGGGGGGYLLPSQFGNQTAHWDASKWATSFYTDAGTTLATAENDLIYRIADISGNNRHLNRETDLTRGSLKLNVQNGLAGLYHASEMSYTSGLAFSNFCGAGDKCFFVVVKNFTSETDSATIYQNDAIFRSTSYWGINVRSSGPIYHYNFDGGVKATGTETLANNVAAVITVWQTGGNLYLQKNLGTVYSAASGNTGNMTNALFLAGGYGAYRCGLYFLEASVHSLYADDAKRTSVITGLMQKWSIS